MTRHYNYQTKKWEPDSEWPPKARWYDYLILFAIGAAVLAATVYGWIWLLGELVKGP